MRTLSCGAAVVAGLVFSAGVAQAQAAPTPVDFRPVANAKNWIVKEPLVYRVGVSNASVTVPRGFVTDFASIPPFLQSLIQQNGPGLLPAVVHDYLYWTQTCTREQADQLFLLAMIENEVPLAERTAMHQTVRVVGQAAWAENTKDRAAGLVRILPESHITVPGLTTWPDYRARLASERVSDRPDGPVAAAFCRRGSMTTEEALRKP